MKVILNESSYSEGKLLAILTGCFYIVFTLIADSHSLMVFWPWVFIWQIGLLLPIFWLILLLFRDRVVCLGNYLDQLLLTIIVGVIVSTLLAEFPHQARWYAWSFCGLIAALYSLNSYLKSSQLRYQLLLKQGYLSLAFIVTSLTLWTTQTFLPELARLDRLKQKGINLSYDFSVLELRNWAPIGHQNYVAGYLVLALPLLVGLSILQTGWRRWMWISGIIFGSIDLYTTSSRGGWLSVLVLLGVVFFFTFIYSSINRFWLLTGLLSSLIVFLSLIVANNRLYSLISSIIHGHGIGGTTYRTINASIGWQMGWSKPWAGIGLGGVPLLYQKYRPVWAGKESELIYQLHSTPGQIWAEMGFWGLISGLGTIAILGYLFWLWLRDYQTNDRVKIDKCDRVFIWTIYASLFAYTIMSLTDYQLDNLSISGTLVIFLAVIASIFREISAPFAQKSRQFSSFFRSRTIGSIGIGILLAMTIWLFPIHRAWQLSNQGFMALKKNQIDTFVTSLSKAQQLAPWEPYYPYQLGWNLGELALQSNDRQQQQQLLKYAIEGFKAGIKVSPYQEFGYSNLGWLLLNSNPENASIAFARAARLLPTKQGVFSSLGISLLAKGKTDLAIQAMILEGLRQPSFIISPIWRSPNLQSIYPQILAGMATKYRQLIEKNPKQPYWHLCRGILSWWGGDLKAARTDLETYDPTLYEFILAITKPQDIRSSQSNLPISTQLLIQAWLNPSQRDKLLQKAWLESTQTSIDPKILQQLRSGMANSSSFQQWLKEKTPIYPYRHERSGFGVVSRHIDGSIPTDFLTIIDNLAIDVWFPQILPTPPEELQIDTILQPECNQLLQSLLP